MAELVKIFRNCDSKLTNESPNGHPSQSIKHIIENYEQSPRITDIDLLEFSDAGLVVFSPGVIRYDVIITMGFRYL